MVVGVVENRFERHLKPHITERVLCVFNVVHLNNELKITNTQRGSWSSKVDKHEAFLLSFVGIKTLFSF